MKIFLSLFTTLFTSLFLLGQPAGFYTSSYPDGFQNGLNIHMSTEVSGTMEVCNDEREVTFTTNITHNAVSMDSVVLFVNAPAGMRIKEVFSETVLPTAENPTRIFLGDLENRTFEIQYTMVADCELLAQFSEVENGSAGSVVSYPLIEFLVQDNNYHLVESNGTDAYPVLIPHIETIADPASAEVLGVRGGMAERYFRIINNGSGALDELTLQVNVDSDPQTAGGQSILKELWLMDGSGPGANPLISLSALETNQAVSTFLLDFNDPDLVQLGLTSLEPDGVLYFRDKTEITGCDDFIETTYTTTWGCDSNVCNENQPEASSTVYINNQKGGPVLSVSASMEQAIELCGADQQFINYTIENTAAHDTEFESLKNLADNIRLSFVSNFPSFSLETFQVKSSATTNEWLSVPPEAIQITGNGNVYQISLEAMSQSGSALEGINKLRGGDSLMVRVLASLLQCPFENEDELFEHSTAPLYLGVLNTNHCGISAGTPSLSFGLFDYTEEAASIDGMLNVAGNSAADVDKERYDYQLTINRRYQDSRNLFYCNTEFRSELMVPTGFELLSASWVSPDSAQVPVAWTAIPGGYQLEGGGREGYFNVAFNYICSQDGTLDGQMTWRYYETCCSTCEKLIAKVDKEILANCNSGVGCTGLNITDFAVNRTTLGWAPASYTVGTLKNTPQLTSATQGMNTKAAYPGDTVQMVVSALVPAGSSIETAQQSLRIQYDQAVGAFQFIGGTLEVGGVTTVLLPGNYSSSSGSSYQVQIPLSGPAVIEAGQVVTAKLDFVVSGMEEAELGVHPLQNLRGGIMGDCGYRFFGDEFSFYKPVVRIADYVLPASQIPEYELRYRGVTSISAMDYRYYGVTATGEDDFPNEFRPLYYPEHIEFQFPDQYQFIPGSAIYSRGFKPSRNANKSFRTNFSAAPSVIANDGRTIVWDANSEIPVFDGTGDYTFGEIFIGFQPNCSVDYQREHTPLIIQSSIQLNYQSYLGANAPINTREYADAPLRYFLWHNQTIEAGSIQEGINTKVQWPVKICNNQEGSPALNTHLNNPWLAIEPQQASTIITNVYDADGNALPLERYGPLDMASNQQYIFVKLPVRVNRNSCYDLIVEAQYQNCEEDSQDLLNLYSSWSSRNDDLQYPQIEGLTGSIVHAAKDCENDIIASEGDLVLNIRVADLLITPLEVSPQVIGLCDQASLEFNLQSIGTGNLNDDLHLRFEIPQGGLFGSEIRLTNPLIGEMVIALSDAVVSSSDDYYYLDFDITGLSAPFSGALTYPDIADRTVKVAFELSGSCTMDVNRPIRVSANVSSNCQDTRIVNTQASLPVVLMQGGEVIEQLDVTLEAGDISTCNGINEVKVTVSNPDQFSHVSGNVEVLIPNGLVYVDESASVTPSSIEHSASHTKLRFRIDLENPITFQTRLDESLDLQNATITYIARTGRNTVAECNNEYCDGVPITTGEGEVSIKLIDDSFSVSINSDSPFPVCALETVQLAALVSGGQAPYKYTWSPQFQTTPQMSFIAFADVRFEVLVEDARGCFAIAEIEVEVIPPISMNYDVIGTSCADVSDGTINATIQNGVAPPFRYVLDESVNGVWTNVSTINSEESTQTYTNLPQRIHRLTVTDAIGCSKRDRISVPNQGSRFAHVCVGKIRCGRTEANVSLNIRRTRPGHMGTFTYQILNSETGIPLSSQGNPGPFQGALGILDFRTYENVTPGNYEIVVLDDIDCEIRRSIYIEPFRYWVETAQANYALCFEGELKDVQVQLSNNITTCTRPSEVVYTLQLEQLNTANNEYERLGEPIVTEEAQYTFEQLGEGQYRIRVQVAGCEEEFTTFAITTEDMLRPEMLVQNPTCSGGPDGSAVLHVFGAGELSYNWYNSVDDELIQRGGASISGLEPGDYYVILSGDACDGNGIDPILFSITSANDLEDLVLLNDGDCSASAEVLGGTAPYIFRWFRSGEVTTYETQINPVTNEPEVVAITDFARQLVHFEQSQDGTSMTPEIPMGTIDVVVRDANGCELTKTFEMERPAVDRRYEICMNWKTRTRPERDEQPDEVPGISGSVLVANNIRASLNNQIEACRTKRSEAEGEGFQRACFDVERVDDELNLEYEVHYQQLTLFYYDRQGQLTRTVPPAGVRLATSREELPAHILDTRYAYNTLGQLTAQQTPDGGASEMVYNDLNQLISSHNQRHGVISNYDELGRIIHTSRDDSTEGTHTVYTRPADWISYEGHAQRFLRNRVSYSFTTNKNGDKEYTYYSYDPHGNVEWLVQEIAGFGRTTLAYEYDLISGNVLKVIFNKGRPDQFLHRYTYDEDNRLLTVATSKDGVLWDRDATQDYYLHGPLNRLELGEDRIQGCDYAYTIHGWLKALNGPSLNPAEDLGQDGISRSQGFAKDVCGMSLQYYQNDYLSDNSIADYRLPGTSNLFNGNITAWAHQIDTDEQEHYSDALTAYSYRYDRLNRIRSTDFYAYDADNANYTDINQFGTDYRYDRNGNITRLRRQAYNGYIDDLSYDYNENTNQLNRVFDEIGNAGMNDLDNQLANNYLYDSIGQLVRDESEAISIEWNIYGKVTAVIPDLATDPTKQKPYLQFSYDAMGNRAKKMVALQPFENGELVTPEAYPDRFKTTYYSCDPSGNVMGIYERNNEWIGTQSGEEPADAHYRPGQCYEGTPEIPVPLEGPAPLANQSIETGETFFITEDFHEPLTLNGGTLVISGNYYGRLTLNAGEVYLTGTADMPTLVTGEQTAVYVYGTLIVQTLFIDAPLHNYGSISTRAELNIRGGEGALYNYGTTQVGSSLNNSAQLYNEGYIRIHQNLVNREESIGTNNRCTMEVYGGLTQYGNLRNRGTLTVYGASYLNPSSETVLESGSLFETATFYLYQTVTNPGPSCAKITTTGIAQLVNGSILDGPIDLCAGDLRDFSGRSAFINGADSDCSCELVPAVGEDLYKAVYTLTEVPLHGSGRLGQLHTEVPVSEVVFLGGDFQTTHFSEDGEERLTADKNVLFAWQQQSSTTNGTCLDVMGVDRFDPVNFNFESLPRFYGQVGNALAQWEDDNGALKLFAVGANYWGQANTLLIYNQEGQLISGQEQATIDEKSKPLFVLNPVAPDRFYLFARTANGRLQIHDIDLANNRLLSSTELEGNSWGRHLAAVELADEGRAHVFLTQYEPGQTRIFKLSLDEGGLGTPQLQTTYESYDSYGDGQLELRPDGRYLSIYQLGKRMGWFSHRQAGILQLPFGADYQLSDEDSNYPRKYVALPYGHLGSGQLAHSADHGFVYYSQEQLVTDPETLGNTGTYRLSMDSPGQELSERRSDARAQVNRHRAGGLLLAVRGAEELSYGDDSKLDTVNAQTLLNYGRRLNAYTAATPHRVYGSQSLTDTLTRELGRKRYELKDHLGNIRAVVSDCKLEEDGQYKAELLAYNNYYAFGMLQPGRNKSSDAYRWGFQGQEKDDEIKGEGNSVNYKYRMHDPRLGRFFAVDPLAAEYPYNSPYAFSENRVVDGVELEGLEFSKSNKGNVYNIKLEFKVTHQKDRVRFDLIIDQFIEFFDALDGYDSDGNYIDFIASEEKDATLTVAFVDEFSSNDPKDKEEKLSDQLAVGKTLNIHHGDVLSGMVEILTRRSTDKVSRMMPSPLREANKKVQFTNGASTILHEIFVHLVGRMVDGSITHKEVADQNSLDQSSFYQQNTVTGIDVNQITPALRKQFIEALDYYLKKENSQENE